MLLKQRCPSRLNSYSEKEKPNGEPILARGDIEIYLEVNCESFKPKTKELIRRADIIQDIPFTSLQDSLKFKKGYGRTKDRLDIALIEQELKKVQV